MYAVSALWETLIAADGHYFNTKVSINGVEYAQSQIMQMSVNLRMFSGTQPSVGGCLSGELTLKMLAPDAIIPRMAEIIPYVQVTNGTQTSEWIPQGHYFIDTRETTKNDDGLPIISFTAYDPILKCEAAYPDTTHAWPMTDVDVADEIAAEIGTGVDARTYALMTDGYEIGLPAGYSMREVLSNIAAMYAGNWVCNYDGELLLVAINGIPPETNYLVDAVGDPITFGTPVTEHTYSSDSIATFESAGVNDMTDLTVTMSPQQSLNGYSNPWPAGGGVNKLKNNGSSGSSDGITWTVNADGSISLSGTAGASYVHIYINTTSTYQLLGSGSISLVCSAQAAYNPSISGINFQNDIYVDGTYVRTIQKGNVTNSYSGAEIKVGTSRLRIAPGTVIPNGTKFYPAIEVGNAISATWAPYSNICPISGWTEAKVTRTGANVWDEEWEIGEINNSTGVKGSGTLVVSKNYIPVIPGTTYYWHSPYGGTRFFYSRDKSFLSVAYPTANTSFTVPSGAYFMMFKMPAVYGTTYNHDISINYPSTDHDYHAYSGNTYTIDLNGTRYGGTLDVLTGVLTVTKANIASYNGETLPGEWISSMDVYAPGTTPTTGAQVVYTLATPQTVQLTPQQVQTLDSTNNVWTDAGAISLSFNTGDAEGAVRILV